MKSNTNKFGLSRNIPDDIKKTIRQNSKYGCVVPHCRNVIYEYEHLIPEFKDAITHDPEKMCLTCPTHNPRKQGPNREELYSKDQLINFYSAIRTAKESIELRNNDIFSGFDNNIKIKMGGLICENVNSLIEIDGKNIFSFRINSNKSLFSPDIHFNGKFEKPNGELLCEIKENEWVSNSNHGDLIYKNGILSIFEENQKPIFSIKKVPTDNTLIIENLDLWVSPFHIYISNNELIVARHDTMSNSYIAAKIEATISHQDAAIKLSSLDLIPKIDFDTSKISYSGNYGFKMENNGITAAFGPGVSRIKRIHILTCSKGQQSGFKFIDIDDLLKKYNG